MKLSAGNVSSSPLVGTWPFFLPLWPGAAAGSRVLRYPTLEHSEAAHYPLGLSPAAATLSQLGPSRQRSKCCAKIYALV